MKIEEFLSRLDKVERSGGGWIACCPAHGDDNPSMSVSAGDDGRILVHCHAGCPAEAIVQTMGLQMRDLMPENVDGIRSRGKMRKKPAPKPEVLPSFAEKKPRDYGTFVAAYEYQDASGAAIYRVERRVRKDGKKLFVQQHPDPDSKYGWAYGVSSAGIERVPFHLPRLLAAAKAGKSVLIVEGEKDVLTAEETLGCAVTCNSGGAGKWEESFARHFAGAKGVVIVADNDPEFKADPKTGKLKPHWKGQRHAVDVERKLRAGGFEGTIKKMVMPSVGETACKDFTDWVEARRAAGLEVGKSAFREALETAGDWPKAWEFGEADLTDLERAQKSARNTALSSAGPAEDNGEFVPAGRFGTEIPRSPSEKTRYYKVDFNMRAGRIARFEIGVDSYRFEMWEKSEAAETFGKWEQRCRFSRVKASANQFFGLALGSMISRDEHFKMSSSGRCELMSSLCLAWMRARGKFFANANHPCYETSMFFDDHSGVLYMLHSNEFRSFVANKTCVNQEDRVYSYMVSLIDDFTMDEDVTPRIVPSKSWDRRGDVIYVSNDDSKICRVSPGKVEMVPNGTDGVVFLRGNTLEPWKLLQGDGVDPFSESMLFKNAALESETDRMNCRLWWFNLFACHKNKPILLVTGPARSGKTRLLQGMKQFLGMRDDGETDDSVNDIDPSDKGLDAFWVVVDRGRFEIFDNYDSKIKWAENAFQTAATDGKSKRRELYKSKSVIVLAANSYIGVTSNNPIFTTGGGGLPDRIVTVRIHGGRKVSLGGELLTDIRRHRNEYLTWLVRKLAAVLADTVPVDETINKRHPDYGNFSVRCGRAFGLESQAIEAMEAAEIDKVVLPLQNDPIAKEIVNVLMCQEPKGCMTFGASEMAEKILAMLGDDGADESTKGVFSARRVGKAIGRLGREFASAFKLNISMFEGKTRYYFNGLTELGRIGFSKCNNLSVDSVDLQGKSPYVSESAGEICPCKSTEPTTHARAPAPTFSSLEEEGNRESKESEAETGGGDEWEFDL